MDPANPHAGDGSGVATTRSPRFTLWVAFLVFSVITLWSSVEARREKENPNSNSGWAVFCGSVTFALTFIVVLMQLHPVSSLFFVGTKAEGVLCIILVAFWAATVSIVSNANNGLAVQEGNGDNTIANGNLYYFSWAGFVTSIVLLVSFMRDAFGVDVVGEIRTRSARLTQWSALLAAGLVVLGSAANIFNEDCNGDPPNKGDTFCTRTKFAIAVGTITTVLSVAVVGIKMATRTSSFALEALLSLILVILNGFGVGFITSAQGPGSPLGNLYYFSWISFVVSFLLVASCFEDFKSSDTDTQQGEDKPPNGEIQVENLDDQI